MTQKVNTYPGEFNEWRAVSTASGGTALSTTVSLTSLIPNTDYVALTPRAFVGANVARFALCPWLMIIDTRNNLATDTHSVANEEEAQDGDTATAFTISAFGGAGKDDYLYIGSHVQFRGVSVNVGSVNAIASVLTVFYWNGSAWVDISATDNT